MNLRELARWLVRTAALYAAIQVILLLPDLIQHHAFRAALSLNISGDLAAAASWFLATSALWFLAPMIAARIAERRASRYAVYVSEDDFLSVVICLLGVLIAAHGFAAVARAATDGTFPTLPRSLSAVLQSAVTVAGAQILIGVLFALLASPFLERIGWLSPPKSRGRGGLLSTDDSITKLIGELMSGNNSTRLARLNELAQTLKAEAEGVAKRVMRNSIDAIMTTVQSRKPDFAASADSDGTVTIAFSDMEGFTAMTERLGDTRALAVIKSHNNIVRGALKMHHGQEVELQGDGFLLAFASPDQALRCAQKIQMDCAAHSAKRGAEPIRVRIGLHTGTPIKEGDRFFGITVILAARIAAQASGGETLISAAVHERVATGDEFTFDAGREAELKGLAGSHRMYAVVSR